MAEKRSAAIELAPGITADPAVCHGKPVVKGTRVPVKALFENLEDGASINDFLAWFPGVSREQAEAVLAHAERSLEVA